MRFCMEMFCSVLSGDGSAFWSVLAVLMPLAGFGFVGARRAALG